MYDVITDEALWKTMIAARLLALEAIAIERLAMSGVDLDALHERVVERNELRRVKVGPQQVLNLVDEAVSRLINTAEVFRGV